MALMALMALMGCSSEADEPSGEKSIPVEVVSCMTNFEEAQRTQESQDSLQSQRVLGTPWSQEGQTSLTRAWLPPSGFTYRDVVGQVIGINFTENGQAPLQGNFFNSSGNWRVNVDLEAKTYYLYGYIPHTAGVTCDISSTSSPNDNSAYSNGAVMTIKKLPAVTSSDVCVVVGAKNGNGNGYNENADYSIGGLARGDFSYVASAVTQEGGGAGNKVFLLFDHLYAALRIQMRVDGNYDALRTIKLKELKLRAFVGDASTPHKKRTDVTVVLQKTTDGADPIQSVTFIPSGDDEVEGSAFYTSTAGQTLTTDYQPFQGHFMPQGVTKMILTSVYDVYDKQNNLIRKDCTAENTIHMDLFSHQTESHRGWRYTVKMTVTPTYLHVLSEPDVDFEVELQ